jgi:hypothetical protein
MTNPLSLEGATRIFSEKTLIRPAEALHMRNQSNGSNRVDSQRFSFHAETSRPSRRSSAFKLNSWEDRRA